MERVIARPRPAAGVVADARATRLPGRWWVWVPLGIFVLSRVVSTAMLVLAGRDQVAPPREVSAFPSDPSLAELLANWDGHWYGLIASDGYPTDLPREDGSVVKNVWAFYPLVPGLARLLALTGLDAVWAASIVAMASSAAASVVLFDMVRRRSDDFTASLAVATLLLGPIGVVFQTTYTEGPALLLVLLALRALGEREWGRVAAYGLLLSFTRPITLALAAVCGLTWLLLWRRRDSEPFPVRDRVRLGAATVAVGASFFAWPTITGLATGEPDAYRMTQSAWLHPDDGWTTWLSGLVGRGSPTITLIGVVTLGIVVWLVARRHADAWPREGRLWAVVYALYILAATRPTPSVLRYLVLTVFPSWPLPELSRRCDTVAKRVALAIPVVLFCCLLQWCWTSVAWVAHGGHSVAP